MKYKKYLDVLKNDTSLEDLRAYKSGKKKFDRRNITKKQEPEVLNTILPKLIAEQEQDNAELLKRWHNAPIFRLAYIHGVNNKKYTRNPDMPYFTWITKIGYDVLKIINKTNEDDKAIAIKQRLIEYCKRNKDVEII